MDINEESVPSTSPLKFGQRTEEAAAVTEPDAQAVETAEAAPTEAFEAEREEDAEASVEVAPEAPVAETAVETETTDVLAQAEAPATEADNAPLEEVASEDAAISIGNLGDTTPSVEDTTDEAEQETEQALAVEPEEETEQSVEKTAEEAVVDIAPVATAPVDSDEPTVEELLKEKEEIEAKLKEKQDAEKASVIQQIKNVMQSYNVPLEDLVEAMGGLKSKRKGIPAKQKYRDPATGITWSGRGKEPAWIKGQDHSKFLI